MTLAPQKTWRGKGTPWLLGEMRKVLDAIPGISYAFSQPIDMRVQEMIIGARGDVVVKIFGDDISQLNRIARDVADQIRKIPGATDVFALRNAGQTYLTVTIDRVRAGRFGLNATDVQDSLRVWVDGRQLGIVLEGAMRVPLFIRGEESVRASDRDLARVPIVRPGGGSVELAQIADVQAEDGPIQVIREGGQRYATVLVNVRGRDLVGFVADAQAAVADNVQVPADYALDWGGQFENQQRAAARLAIVLPIALGVDLPVALPDVRIAAPGDAGVLQRAVRHHRRHRRVVGVRPISVGAGVGRLHRADRDRRAQRRGADHLYQRGRGARRHCRSAKPSWKARAGACDR